ncbi:hypothetical protein [Stenotrophomonas sp.]|uniref:hypothetical protein n=1 Tax=Stenotrophomonas sp. TaxID=69392 RepID=UPI0028ACE483|nr:hypothetical protein [Stenotrophomonas sp.]
MTIRTQGRLMTGEKRMPESSRRAGQLRTGLAHALSPLNAVKRWRHGIGNSPDCHPGSTGNPFRYMATKPESQAKKKAPECLFFLGAEGGTRTHTLLRAADFESEQERRRTNGFGAICVPQSGEKAPPESLM